MKINYRPDVFDDPTYCESKFNKCFYIVRPVEQLPYDANYWCGLFPENKKIGNLFSSESPFCKKISECKKLYSEQSKRLQQGAKC